MNYPAALDQSSTPHQDEGFVKRLNLTSATTLVMGCMVGSGIYLVSADISRLVQSPALLLAAWMITGVMTIIGGLAYGELAAMMPRVGGQYVFLRESLGPLWGFLYGWTYFLVIQCGTIAAVGVAVGKFVGVFLPSISSSHWLVLHYRVPLVRLGFMTTGNMEVGLNTQNLIAIGSILLLSGLNILTVRVSAIVQNVLTFAKITALLGLIAIGYFFGKNRIAIAANFGHNFWHNAAFGAVHQIPIGVGGGTRTVGLLTLLALAQVGSLFAADAWNSVTFTAAEVRNPSRNLPLALALGTGTIITLYLLTNVIYLLTLPLAGSPHGYTALTRGIQYASEDRVAVAVMQQAVGSVGASLMVIAILLSTFGANNGLIFSGARCYYAMAKDGLFFKSVGRLHPKYRTPHISLIVQALWASLLCLSGSYEQLLDYTMFAVLLFYILTFIGLFVLRKKKPNAHRPYRAFGYPVLPALYIGMAIFIDAVWLCYKPQYTWPGLFIVMLGVPVYLFWSRRGVKAGVKGNE
jgi:APA family basic amino acid/polyamine antiporter